MERVLYKPFAKLVRVTSWTIEYDRLEFCGSHRSRNDRPGLLHCVTISTHTVRVKDAELRERTQKQHEGGCRFKICVQDTDDAQGSEAQERCGGVDGIALETQLLDRRQFLGYSWEIFVNPGRCLCRDQSQVDLFHVWTNPRTFLQNTQEFLAVLDVQANNLEKPPARAREELVGRKAAVLQALDIVMEKVHDSIYELW